MIFKNPLFKPKWQSSDPRVRRQAVQDISDGADPVVRSLACEDDSPEVRVAALQRLSDLALLLDRFRGDSEPQVQRAAGERLCACVAAGAVEAADQAWLLEQLHSVSANSLIECLARQAEDTAIRRSALGYLESDRLRAEIALHDPVGELRLEAAQAIADRATLAELVQSSRQKDKGVHRVAQQRLQLIEEALARPQRHREAAAHILERLEAALSENRLDALSLEALDREWTDLDALDAPELSERYAALCHQVEAQRAAAREAEAAVQERDRERHQLCEQLESLAERLKAAPMDEPGALQSAESRRAEIVAAWDALNPEEPDGPTAERWQRATRSFEEARSAVQERQGLHTRALELESTFSGWQGELGSVPENRLKRWDNDCRETRAALDAHDEAPAQARREALAAQAETLQAELERRAGHRRAARDQAEQGLQALERALDEGRLHQAREARQTIQGAIKHMEPASRRGTEKRLKGFEGRIKELEDWQRWGIAKSREELCEEVEGLIGADLNPEELQQKIQTAQKTWKKLDKEDPASGRRMWPRFNEACNKAYEPCRAYFQERAKERQTNREQREALCEQLENTLAEVDWDDPDWSYLDRFARKIRQEWRNLGPTDRKHRKILEDRYRRSMDPLNTKLDEERERNLALKRELIAEAEALAETDNLNEAIEAAKALQKRWVTRVSAKRHVERELWERFRGACDRVFERRREQFHAQDQERQANLKKREALCEAAEALLTTEDEAEIPKARSRLRQLQNEWRQQGEVPRRDQDRIENRFRQSVQQAERHLGSLRQAKQARQLEQLRAKGALCERAETAAFGASDDDRATLENAWDALDPLEDRELDEHLRARFDAALGILEGTRSGSEAGSDAQRDRLSELCIRFEILAELESPPEAAQERMAYQVKRLSEAMEERRRQGRNKAEEAAEIERAWYATGPVDPAIRQPLEVRFNRARNAFHRTENA